MLAIGLIAIGSMIALPVFAQRPGNDQMDTFGGSDGGIENPLGSTDSLTKVLKNVINWMLGLVGFLALIALIVGGGRMIVDFGNEEQVKKAKATILWAVVGLAVVVLSYAIINIVVSDILGAGGRTSPGDTNGGQQINNQFGN